MKRWLKQGIIGGLLAVGLGMQPLVADANSMDKLIEGKLCVVGSIADLQELRLTMSFLEQSGMKGAFVVSAAEARRYPEHLQLIAKRGHAVILEMDESAKAGSTQVKQQLARPPRRPVAPAPRNESRGGFQAQGAAAPLITEHLGMNSNSVRERRARVQGSSTKDASTQGSVTAKAKEGKGFLYPEKKTNGAMKVVGNADAANVKLEQKKKLSRKQQLDKYFYGVDDRGRKLTVRVPSTAKNVEDVPSWSLQSIAKLSDYGLVAPDDVREIESVPDRELMAKLVARSYNMFNQGYAADNEYNARFELDKLMHEYDYELRNLGYGAGYFANYATETAKSREPRIGGELRYNYVDHSGYHPNPDYDFFDSRIRLRLYLEQPLDDNWKVYAMGEGNKSWFKDVKSFALQRLYISGDYKDWKITAGRYGTFYGDGNVYDGRIVGVRVQGGKAVMLRAEYGELREGQRGGAIIANYSDPRYDLEAGLYNFSNVKSYGNTTIGSFGGMYYIGNFGLGAMYLYTSADGIGDNSNNGCVVTLKYGRMRSWLPGSYEIFAKYYNQPDATYMGHTMVGLADYMRGFSGYGVGAYYTLMENVVYGIEYYDLKDKAGGRKGRTLWNHVSLFF